MISTFQRLTILTSSQQFGNILGWYKEQPRVMKAAEQKPAFHWSLFVQHLIEKIEVENQRET